MEGIIKPKPGNEQIFNQGQPRDKVRVENASIALMCGRAILVFDVAAMDANCTPTGGDAPWLFIELLDRDGESVSGNVQVVEASTGGQSATSYKNGPLDITSKFSPAVLNAARWFRMSMPGGCNC